MTILHLIGPVIALLAGLAVCGWGLACRAGRFPRNPVFGYRTRTALSSQAAWVAAHRGAAPVLIGGGVLLAVSGATATVLVVSDAGELVGPVITAGIVALLASLVVGGIFARKALRRHLEQTG